MNSKFKTTLLTSFLFFILMTSVQAQDKYDFAVVQLERPQMGKMGLYVHFDNKAFEDIELTKEDLKNGFLFPLLKKVSELQSQGWEVYNIGILPYNGGFHSHFYYLRKKQQ